MLNANTVLIVAMVCLTTVELAKMYFENKNTTPKKVTKKK